MKRLFAAAALAVLFCTAAAAQVKISELPSATPTTTDIVAFVAMSGTPATKKTTISDLFAAFSVMPSAVPSGSKNGNGSKFQLFTGSAAANDCAKFDASGNLVSAGGPCSSSGITSVGGQTGATQTFADVDDTNVTLTIGSASNTHTFTLGWAGTLSVARGGTGAGDAAGARTSLGLGTAATLNVPSSGNAAAGEVVKGDDTRLTNARTPTGGAGGVLSGSYPSPGFAVDMAEQGELDAHALNTSNPHSVTKAQVGLGNVTNDAQLKLASNLSDLASASTARTNLGLGSAATSSSSDFAAASHTHAAADVASGTLDKNRVPGTLNATTAPSFTVSGTAGSGFVSFSSQSSTPSPPASGFVEFADSTGRRSWRRASDGFTRTWDATLTADRVYTLPDRSATVATTTGTLTSGNCAKFDASGNIVDAGAACGSGGGGGGSLSFTAPTFGTGWSNWGSTFAAAGYAKTSEGLVILKGTVKGGAQGSTIFTLPAGFRPGADLIISTQNGGSFGYVIVHADGTVTADTYTNTGWTLSLDTVRFVAEQ